MEKTIALVAGDGIGPEIIAEARKVLEHTAQKFNLRFNFEEVPAGGAAIDKTGEPLPKETLDVCRKSDSVLLGAVGGPKWDSLPGKSRPEQAILGLRRELDLYTNIRPTKIFPSLQAASPLKQSIIDKGIDFIIVRELIGGLYIGKGCTKINAAGHLEAQDILIYSEPEIERVGRIAFELAQKRRKKLTSVDKANVLESSRLWRKVMSRLKEDYPDVAYENMLVDNCAMQLVRNPGQFDVIVTENMFGDILSDEASILGGSIGLIPSMSLGKDRKGLYEPIHGSAPDIAGQNKANPIGTVLSAALMLRHSFNLPEAAKVIEAAVETVLNLNYVTADMAVEGKTVVSCSQMGDLICKYI